MNVLAQKDYSFTFMRPGEKLITPILACIVGEKS
jgi:hypothetical protein